MRAAALSGRGAAQRVWVHICVALLLAQAGTRRATARPFTPELFAESAGAGGVADAKAQHLAEHAAAAVAHGAAFWKSDVVVVVTWYNHDIAWLAALPLRHVRLAIYVKGNKRRCTDVPAALHKAVALCREVHNAAGREAHTIALFALQWYDALPRITIFAQDDAPPPRHRSQLLRLAGHGPAEMARWTEEAERHPFAGPDTCLCRVIVEDWWRPCPSEVPFPKDMPRCYGDTYWPMRWFMETLLDFPHAGEAWQHARWPEAAQLAVPAWAIRSRPKAVYAVAYALLNGSRMDGVEGPEGVNADAYDPPLLYRSAALGRRPWSPHEWAHVFERLWFAVFDARYTPNPEQEGGNATAAAEHKAALAVIGQRAAAAAGFPVLVQAAKPTAATPQAEPAVEVLQKVEAEAEAEAAPAPAAPAADITAFLAHAGYTRAEAAGGDVPLAAAAAQQQQGDGGVLEDDVAALEQPEVGSLVVPDAATFLAQARSPN